ncbi:hypothetical protein SAMN05216249_10234 [Acetitomaculum ruminis DSM 5522]|uniref:YprB ribonuclease H-like domain-containing protein n=1 Tax=Acetitomaculum ruminis DSM 5522 TaxID=1120918 RepID=A0A1I0VKY0_9FIRM|nr:ribonuclease H-like domain-containing protein [Acetitomaculum ruminis]SFA76226.1 hypothetical protein SAMN05216249_10234 [Acetitomaculum ruminis DSM 5522]
MATLIKDLKINIQSPFLNANSSEKILFFDIETTGFSAKTSKLYLIGGIYRFMGNWKIIQFFLDSDENEKDLLYDFMSFASEYTLLISYNGTGFDTRFLWEKCQLLDVEYTLDNLTHFDIYKEISRYKPFFKLSHMKQKNIEEFLGVNREDQFDGGQLIQKYFDYIMTPNDEDKKLLLLHNSDDLFGMIQILSIVHYSKFFSGSFEIKKLSIDEYSNKDGEVQKEALFELSLHLPLEKRISFGNDIFYITASKKTAFMKVPILKAEMKFFYPNYKDYYYLPQEDMAIHKSVAFYVDKDFKTKAKAANCYGKKSGEFLVQYEQIVSPYFKKEYNDKTSYFELTNEFIRNPAKIKEYVLHIFKYLLKKQR